MYIDVTAQRLKAGSTWLKCRHCSSDALIRIYEQVLDVGSGVAEKKS